jgi:hypothetical protein
MAKQVIGAFKAYGLIELQGEQSKAELRISERSFRIILNHEDRAGLIRAAALGPNIYRELWKKYGDDGIPPDDSLKHHLLFDLKFNPESVDGLIAQFKDTISFAKLDSSDKIGPDGTEASEDSSESHGEVQIPKIGDFVQWESQGALRFPNPLRVTGVSDDGSHLFVEGSMTGIPIEQTRIEKTPAATAPEIPTHLKAPPRAPGYAPPIFSPPGSKQDVFTLDSGSFVVQWPQTLTEAEFTDINEWVKILLRKIKRSVAGTDGGTADSGGQA